MTQQEIEKLLQKISNQRMFGETDKAVLANLHVLSNAFPDEKNMNKKWNRSGNKEV